MQCKASRKVMDHGGIASLTASVFSPKCPAFVGFCLAFSGARQIPHTFALIAPRQTGKSAMGGCPGAGWMEGLCQHWPPKSQTWPPALFRLWHSKMESQGPRRHSFTFSFCEQHNSHSESLLPNHPLEGFATRQLHQKFLDVFRRGI